MGEGHRGRRETATVALLAMILVVNPACSRRTSSQAAIGELPRSAADYKIEILTTDPSFPVRTVHGRIEGRRADLRAIEDYAPMFVAEFGLYPPELVRRSGLQRVVLCANLAYAGQ